MGLIIAKYIPVKPYHFSCSYLRETRPEPTPVPPVGRKPGKMAGFRRFRSLNRCRGTLGHRAGEQASTRPSSTRPSSTRPSSTRPSSTRPSSTRPSSTGHRAQARRAPGRGSIATGQGIYCHRAGDLLPPGRRASGRCAAIPAAAPGPGPSGTGPGPVRFKLHGPSAADLFN